MEGRGERCGEGVASLLKRLVSNLWAVKLFSPKEPFKLSVISNNPPGHSATVLGSSQIFSPHLPSLFFCSSNRPQCHSG